jgi:hypothetical protein
MQKWSMFGLSLFLVACQPATPIQAPPSASPSPTPTAMPTPEPTSLPQATATPTEPPAPSLPSATPTFEPQALPSLIPVPSVAAAPWQGGWLELTEFKGMVYNDQGLPLDGAKVKVEMKVDYLPPYSQETRTEQGLYRLMAPTGSLIELNVSYPGLAARKRTEVLKIGALSHPFANRFDFGTNETEYLSTTDQYARASMDASRILALADSPEVVKVEPDLKNLKIAHDSGFTLYFSEPIERASLEASLAIRSFKNQKLQVDKLSGKTTLSGSENIQQPDGDLVWTSDAFDKVWSVGDQSLKLVFKPGYGWPANSNETDFPQYLISFNAPGSAGLGLQDKTGATRLQDWFRLKPYEVTQSLSLTVAADNSPFFLKELTYQTGTETEKDLTLPSLFLRYSKPIWLDARSRMIAGGMADFYNLPGAELQSPAEYPNNKGNATARNAAKNYRVLIIKPGSTDPALFSGTWFELGGSVVYDLTDPGHSVVKLLLPTDYDKSLFQAGNQIQINGVISILDPAGNALTVGTPLSVLIP